MLNGENPGTVADDDHRAWYREMFAPSATAGLLNASDLARYRNGQVFIRKSMHVPLNKDAVRDAMPAFFDLLRAEEHPAVRGVLGHFGARITLSGRPVLPAERISDRIAAVESAEDIPLLIGGKVSMPERD